MASLGGNVMAIDIGYPTLFTGVAAALAGTVYLFSYLSPKDAAGEINDQPPGLAKSFALFFYSCFVKPHSQRDRGTQQDALESFYKTQAAAYDTTRKVLLQGREDMLALAAAQLQAKSEMQTGAGKRRRIWVDVGGGTGYNIEAMSRFLNVPEFFSSVYLVDFSPSLCEVATKRFKKLGWENVKVVCADARTFRLSDHEDVLDYIQSSSYWAKDRHFAEEQPGYDTADLVTMSYSLSMIPDYHSVIDSLASLLSPHGILGVIDFYVQSEADFTYRNYTGGFIGRHVSFIARTLWRAWFDLDRVSLDPGRRDYLEYRFGTLLGLNCRNRSLGSIPYYVWLGVSKAPPSLGSFPDIKSQAKASTTLPHATNQDDFLKIITKAHVPAFRSKDLAAATRNLSTGLPLPTALYQNRNWRLHYDGHLQKHLQFNDEYIYAFTWEDARVDERILKLGPDDVVLAITSAGDNILSYARQGPARIHAVDLNPSQNHLLELKMAAYSALPYADFWKIFGEGKHPDFRHILLTKLSPHLSSRAFQYWFMNSHIFSDGGCGLYHTGGSRHALTVVRWVTRLFRCRAAIKAMLECKTLNEQREVWRGTVRPALLTTLVCNAFLSHEPFLWAALGVPKNQLAMIEEDHAESAAVRGPNPTWKNKRSHAIWNYMVNTLDPIAEETHIATDNPYYYVCLAGQFSPSCHPDYLSSQTHERLSQPGALDGLRIHTDEVEEVVAGISPGTLTVAVVMDSMDWFDPGSGAAATQIAGLNRALAMGGRVLLRSAGLAPWYLKVFEAHGFEARKVGAREGPVCIDRVNMYASCWLCVKVGNLPPPTPEMDTLEGSTVNPLFL